MLDDEVYKNLVGRGNNDYEFVSTARYVETTGPVEYKSDTSNIMDFFIRFPEILVAGLLALFLVFIGVFVLNPLFWIAVFGTWFGLYKLRRSRK